MKTYYATDPERMDRGFAAAVIDSFNAKDDAAAIAYAKSYVRVERGKRFDLWVDM